MMVVCKMNEKNMFVESLGLFVFVVWLINVFSERLCEGRM